MLEREEGSPPKETRNHLYRSSSSSSSWGTGEEWMEWDDPVEKWKNTRQLEKKSTKHLTFVVLVAVVAVVCE